MFTDDWQRRARGKKARSMIFVPKIYDPEITLLVMERSRRLSAEDEARIGNLHRRPGYARSWFLIWSSLEEILNERPLSDFSENIGAILRLNSQVQKKAAGWPW